MRGAFLTSAVLGAGLALLCPRPAAACSCTNELTLQEEFDYAWIVFSGRVVSVQPGLNGYLEVRLAPIERWKGPLYDLQLVVTPEDAGVCGYAFEVDQEHLVFCSVLPYGISMTATPFTHLCARTSPLAGNPYLADLPPPLVTTPASRPTWGTLKLRYR